MRSAAGRRTASQRRRRDAPCTRAAGQALTTRVLPTFRRPPRVGLIQGQRYLNQDPDGRAFLYDLRAADPKDLSATEPDTAQRMQALARANLAWSHFLLSHNPPIEAKP